MQIKKNVVAEKDGVTLVVDLADFPHGELDSARKDDKYDIEFYKVPEGVRVASYDEQTGTPVFHDVKYWSVHRGKKIEIVNLDDGRQILTDNDPRAVYGVSTKCDKIEFHRYTPSDAMDADVMIPVTNSPIASSVDGLFYSFESGLICNTQESSCVDIGFDLGQFVGIMAGDGWADVDHNPYLADNEGFNIQFVSSFLKAGPYPEFHAAGRKFSSTEIPGRYGDTTRYRLNTGTMSFGTRVKELVDGHGNEFTSGSANKRLPIWYQFAGKDFILGLVNGLIATDGTVCVTNGKDTPQLKIAFNSTSLRLVREFKRCCQLLGVKASISYSKDTSGGNKSWQCSVSTIGAKSAHLLDRCCHERKRAIFLNTSVDMSDRNVKNDVIPFPKGVASRIVSLVPAAKVSGTDLSRLSEEEVSRRRRYQDLAICVRTYAKTGYITRSVVRRVNRLGDELANKNTETFNKGNTLLNTIELRFSTFISNDSGGSRRSWKVDMSVEEADTIASMLASAKPRFCSTWATDAKSSTVALSIVRKKGFITWGQLCDIKGFFNLHPTPNTELRDSSDLADLVRLTESDVTWVRILSVEKTGQAEVGYDLTVPGPDTFISDDGIVLSNTVNIHLPASEKASKEALEKMLPSKNLISLTDLKSVRYKPEKEQVSGLWALTRQSDTNKKPVVFKSREDVLKAYRRGEIDPTDPVVIR